MPQFTDEDHLIHEMMAELARLAMRLQAHDEEHDFDAKLEQYMERWHELLRQRGKQVA